MSAKEQEDTEIITQNSDINSINMNSFLRTEITQHSKSQKTLQTAPDDRTKKVKVFALEDNTFHCKRWNKSHKYPFFSSCLPAQAYVSRCLEELPLNITAITSPF